MLLKLKIFCALLAISISAMAQSKNVSVFVYNVSQQQTIVDTNSQLMRPIASITKLVTAMVTLDYEQNLQAALPLVAHRQQRFRSRKDMITAMLIRSDNMAAEYIAQDYPGGSMAFVRAMNAKVRSLGLNLTNFYDPTGLSVFNTSTAQEVAKIVEAANQYAAIKSIANQKTAVIETWNLNSIVLRNTNYLIMDQFDNIVISKTGFTNPAGWCVALAVRSQAQDYIIVILGEPDKYHRANTVSSIMQTYIL